MLGWGLRTGKMPEKYVDIDRRKQPFWFWFGGALYAIFCLGCLYAAFAA
jgi:hypothetical protein